MATAKLDIKNSKIILIFAILMLLSSLAFAIPNTLTLQGKLTNKNGVSQQGSFTFQFRIYDVPDFGYYNITQNATFPNGSFSHEFNVTHINYTNILWEQNQTVVTDANGVYDVVLHDINLSFAYQYWLGITVGSDNESTPRVNLSSAPYSFRANVSEALNANNSYFVTNLSVSGNLTVGTIFYIDSANARIGINTTSPAQTLTLQGTLNVTPAGRGGNASLFVASSGFVGIGITNPQYLLQVGNASKAVNLSNILFVSGDSGNVGIGTSSPTALLQLAASAPELRLNSTNGGYIGLKTNSAALTDFDIQQNGTSRLYIDTSGNVGIGTTTPGEILHVIGNVNASGVYKGDADGSATAPIYTYYNDTNTGEFSPLPDTLAFTTGGTERARIDSSGSVGIGTTSPYNTLTVVGSVGVSGSLNASSINTTGSAYFATSSGSVGIGTTSPYNTLTVVGSVGVSGSLNASSINTTGSAYFATSSGSVGIGTTSPGQKLVVVGGVNITGGLNVTGDTNASNLYTTGNVVLGDASTDTIAVNAQFTTNLIPNQNNVDIGSATNFWRRAYFDRATISNLSVTGNTSVGGTNSPTWTLNSNYTGDDAIDVELILERGTPTINAVFKWDSTDKRFDINFPLFIQANQNLTVDTNTLFVDGSINRVGIGTATPTHTLTVAGDINATGAIFGGAINVTSGGLNILGTSDLGIGTSAPDNRLTIVGSDRDSNLPLQGILHLNITDNYNQSTTNLITLDHLLVNPNNASTIAQAGGIGIGILFRAINNNSEVVNVSFINASLVNARNGSEASALSFYTRSGQGALTPKLILNGSDVFIGGTASTGGAITVLNSGNVGIGTASPSVNLHIGSGTIIDADTYSATAGVFSPDSARFHISGDGAGGASRLLLTRKENAAQERNFVVSHANGLFTLGIINDNFGGGTSYLAINVSTGNVGIGTTAPASKLEVAGTFNATSSSTQFLVNPNGDVVVNLKG